MKKYLAAAIISDSATLSRVGKTLDLLGLLSSSLRNAVVWLAGTTAYAYESELPTEETVDGQIIFELVLKMRKGYVLSPNPYGVGPNHSLWWSTELAATTDGAYVRAGDHVNGEEVPGIDLYSDYFGHVSLDKWGMDPNLLISPDPFHGTSAFGLQPLNSWSGINFHFNTSWNPSAYGALTFAIKADQALRVYPYVRLSDGTVINTGIEVSDYLYGSINSDWKVVWIPLRDLGLAMSTPYTVTDIIFEFNSAGVVWVDEMRVVEKLRWVLPEVAVGKVSGFKFGVIWDPSPSKRHVAVDYSSDQVAGKTVVAAHSGRIVKLHEDTNGWKWHMVIQSKGKAFMTTYTHVVPEAGIKADYDAGKVVNVEAGDPIGVTAELNDIYDSVTGTYKDYGPHLHFILHLYESPLLDGAIPAADFPGKYVDPELIDWQ